MAWSGWVKSPGAGTAPPACLATNDKHPLRQIAQVVGEVAVHAMHHRAHRKIPVIAERHLAQQEIAGLLQTIGLDQLVGIDHIAEIWRFSRPRWSTSRARRHVLAAPGRRPSKRPASKPRGTAEYPCRPCANRPASLVYSHSVSGKPAAVISGQRVEPRTVCWSSSALRCPI